MYNWLKYIFCWILFFCMGISQGFGQLKADFTTSNPSGCTPVVVNFKDISTGNPDKWKWEIGQAGIYETKDISAVYVNPGSYTIKLTVYQGIDSSSVTKVGLVNVYDYPVAIFEADKLEGCIPLRVNFTNKSNPGSGTIDSAVWDFGDGNSGSAINPIHTFRTSGNYNVTLTVSNSFGCRKSIAYSNYIHVFDSVQADFDFKIIPSCGAPFIAEFSNKSIGISITQWNWSFGDGATSLAKDPINNYAAIGNYSVRLIAKNAEGCSDTLSKSLTIEAGNFTAGFTSSNNVCKGQSVIFTNTSSPLNLADSAFWDFGDGTTSKAISPKKVYSAPGNYDIKLIMYFGNCQVSNQGEVTILPGPTVDFSATPVFACRPPLTVNFTGTVSDGTILSWRIGPQVIGPQISPKVTLTTYGNFNVRLVAQATNGCFDTLFKPNYIQIQKPTISGFPGLPFKGCFPWTNAFSANIVSVDSITGWEWDFGDGRTSNQKNPTITYSKKGDYIVKLKVTTLNGCTDSLTTTVKGGLKPVVDFTATPLNVCPSEPVTFTPNIIGTYDSLKWVFGDGGISQLPNPDHLYRDTGRMNVTLYAWDNGCLDSLTYPELIYVNPPLAKFGIVNNCSNRFERRFLDSSFGATNWLWNFGNGVTSTERSPVYVYPDTGRYTVTLRVNDDKCFHTYSLGIKILDEQPDFEVLQQGSCDSTLLVLTAKGPKLEPLNIMNYAWRFGDGVSIAFGASEVARVFRNAIPLNVRLTVTDLNGCLRSATKDLDIKLLGPIANIKPVPVLSCVGKPITFQDSSYANPASPIIKWTWHFGDGTVKTFSKPPFIHTYNDTGSYHLKLVVEDGNGCIDSVRLLNAVGIFNPSANFVSPDTIVCANTNVRFENLSKGYGLKYRWTLGENDHYNEFEPVKQYIKSGKYTIRLQVTDTAGCISVLNRPAYIDVGGLTADFTMSDSLASCPPLLVHFTDKSRGATNIRWDFNNGNTSILANPSQTFIQTGSFRVKLTTTGNGGCIDTMVRNVIIRGPQGTITYSPLSGCPPLQVTFSSNSANVKSYIWDFSDGQTSFTTDSTVTYTYLTPGIYRPRVILEDGQACRIPIQGSKDIKIIGVKSQVKSLISYQYCDSAVIAFFDSSISNDAVKRWEWDFGDGTKSNDQNPVHKYSAPGKYKVSLLVETFDNCINLSVLSSDIVINKSPEIEAIRDTTFCLPGNILFKGQWLNPDSSSLQWQWDFGNGTTSNLQYPDSVYYNIKGVYQQTLRVTHNNGCSSLDSSRITVKDRAEAYIMDIGNYQFCNSGTVAFKDSTTNENLIDKWKWDFGDGNFSSQRNPVYTYTKPGRYRASLTVETSQNCISVNLLPSEIVVAPLPRMNIGPDTVICLSSQFTFKPTWLNPDTTSVTYQWDFGNGTTSSSRNPLPVTFEQAGFFNVKLRTQNDYGCSDSAMRQVRVHNDPAIIIDKLAYGVFCDSAVINLTSNIVSTDSISTYLWSFGDGTTSSDMNPSHIYNTPGKFKIGLAVTTVNNCPAKADYDGEVTLVIRPRINFTSDSIFCGPSSVSFTGKWLNPDTATLNWKWDFGNGLTSNKEKPDPVLYEHTGTYQAKLTVSDQVGCSDSLTRPIRINDVPKVLITQLIPDKLCDSATVAFSGQVISSDSITGYLWNFGDGTTSTQANPTYTYTRPGQYKVSLSVNTPFNCPATGRYNGAITLASSPKIRVLSDSVLCATSSIVFEGQWLNQDTTVLTWDWDFGNGKTGTGIKPAPVDFENKGTYKVVTVATSNFGCKDSITRNVVVNDLPIVTINTLSQFVYCDSATIQFRETTVVDGTPNSWQWNFGDGTTSTQREPVHTYKKPGIYNISLKVGTTSNCSSISNLSGPVVIAQSPDITLPGDTLFCIPNGVYFGAEWLNPDTTTLKWSWNFGNGQADTNQLPGLIRYDKPGNYTATLRAVNLYGCWDSLSRLIVAKDTPNMKISGSVITCQGQGVPLIASGAESYRWKPQVSLSCYTCPNPVATPLASQVYTVTGSNGPGAGCERSKSLQIGIVQPRRIISSKGDSLCVGESYQLMASGLDKYTWSPATGLSATNIPNPTARPQQSITYRVIATDSLNCFSDTAFVPVGVFNKPVVNILKDKYTGFAGTKITLETVSADVTRWRWSPSTGLSCITCPSPELTITKLITYKVWVTNPGGCEAVDEVAIEPICSSEDIFVPNTFSPNADGRNDVFFPMGKGISVIKSLRIYNRWGEVVFERQNFQPNDPSAGWDGTFKGRPLNPDIYVYAMVLLCFNNESIDMKGNVTLLK